MATFHEQIVIFALGEDAATSKNMVMKGFHVEINKVPFGVIAHFANLATTYCSVFSVPRAPHFNVDVQLPPPTVFCKDGTFLISPKNTLEIHGQH
jgi:hypothetical protein